MEHGKDPAPAGLAEAQAEVERLRTALKRSEAENRALELMSDSADRRRGKDEALMRRLALENRLLLEHSQNMLFLFDTSLRLVACSRACTPLLSDSSPAALVGAPFDQVFTDELDPAWRARAHRQNLEVLETQDPVEYDAAIDFGVEDTLHAQVAIWPIIEDTVVQGTLMVLTDTTELAAARRRAEETARATAATLASLSHELRTPMNAVRGLAELLSLSELDNLQRSYVAGIISSAGDVVRVVSDLVEHGHADAGAVALTEGRYLVAELLAEVTNVMGLRAEEQALDFFVDADPAMPSLLWGDSVHLKQILLNLLTSAMEHTASGQVQLALSAEAGPGGEARLHCRVSGSGEGIPPEELVRLLDEDAEPGAATRGIVASRQLVQAMGGEFTLESAPGQGVTTRLWVPQRVVDARPLAQVEDPGARVLLLGRGENMDSIGRKLKALKVRFTQAAEDAVSSLPEVFTHCIYAGGTTQHTLRTLRGRMPQCLFASLRNMRNAFTGPEIQDAVLFIPLLITDLARFIGRRAGEAETAPVLTQPDETGGFATRDALLLVVDDNEINLMVSTEMLRAFGAEVDTAQSGAEALRMCGEKVYDIIFMDHMMPEMDGVEVTARLRGQAGPNQQTPIVALTANVQADMQSYYVRCGMDDYLPKPVEYQELGQMLNRWLPPDKVLACPVEGMPGT